ncbi:efflux RND transporter periplasmic adaptor subunit [Ensifer sp. T173]|uniref:Efflux RND transporter periplasmic adaptor subunit n=1 Tax=Ensifer canadensis TaxID=555315 RepID=A0AAW4FWQ4_9HYPH|nr:efflux RND transporter periplasmic adaptor subunit [Ensifer canadensis]MBM3095699.1 efflux RND transporter periplasmic adaptor subunit [Ensifer canadensis]UBI79560.1 efflux RND transporter periplasmic adaptor subunit [Ensifer canadensis]
MKRKHVLTFVGLVAAAAAAGAFFLVFEPARREAEAADPRTASPLVRVAEAARTGTAERSFTGAVASRVQSNLGFRVPGKILERMVDVGQQVRQGQALMRIDETDLQLALTAKRNTAAAARAVLIQVQADEKRYAALVKNGLAATPQRYEQAKAALDTAMAQLAAAEAEAEVAENAASYTVLLADSDGIVIDTLGDPGQVVAAGQTVIQLAQAGPREAVVWLPETLRPKIGSEAQASVYGGEGLSGKARLRQISDSADPQTRTYEARYILEGNAASAPIGSTVTIRILDADRQSEVAVPVGAILDDGSRTGVWVVDNTSSSVKFTPIEVKRIGEETAFVIGVGVGQQVVALGAHLLENGATVRVASQQEVTK